MTVGFPARASIARCEIQELTAQGRLMSYEQELGKREGETDALEQILDAVSGNHRMECHG
jgi:hypothetical protein